MIACPRACLDIGGDGGGDARYTIAREQAAYKCDTLDVGITILFAEAQAFAQVRAHDITIQYLNIAPTRLETLFDHLRKRAFASARKTCKPESKTSSCHVVFLPPNCLIIFIRCSQDQATRLGAYGLCPYLLECLALHIGGKRTH